MITCEECGCLVDPSDEMLQRHSDWHDDLVTKKELTSSSLANRDRTKLNDIIIKDC